jgi:hypothetical protein
VNKFKEELDAASGKHMCPDVSPQTDVSGLGRIFHALKRKLKA